jgi:hypothetical protein
MARRDAASILHPVVPTIPFALLALAAGASTHGNSRSAPDSSDRARAFLASLDGPQRARASFAAGDARRLDWHYVPRERAGVTLGELGAEPSKAFRALLGATLSDEGLRRFDGILRLEGVLREVESSPARDPGRYAVAVYGAPSSDAPWAWRVEGHHLSLNVSAAGDRVAVTPFFLGANPARVEGGPYDGLRVLGEEEDLACELARSFKPAQRASGVHEKDVPADVILGPGHAASFLEPAGIAASELDAGQRALLARLVATYAGDFAADLHGAAIDRLRAAGEASPGGAPDLHFLWVGGTDRGAPHYWRVQGRVFAIELDDVQGGANHVHTLWRDFEADFGEDLLRKHREEHHRGEGAPR